MDKKKLFSDESSASVQQQKNEVSEQKIRKNIYAMVRQTSNNRQTTLRKEIENVVAEIMLKNSLFNKTLSVALEGVPAKVFH